MFTFVHNESGNVNRMALGSKTINPIEPSRRQHSQSRGAVITPYPINIKDGLFQTYDFKFVSKAASPLRHGEIIKNFVLKFAH